MHLKGATNIDRNLHSLMDYYDNLFEGNSYGTTRVDNYIASYHEDRLYSVYDRVAKECSLVYADSPYKAIEKVMGYRNTTVIQEGTNCQHITNRGSLTINL